MSDEDKKAIEDIKLNINMPIPGDCAICEIDDLNIILNLISKQQQEIEIKDKTINEMVNVIMSIAKEEIQW